jgi:hypothetical protein
VVQGGGPAGEEPEAVVRWCARLFAVYAARVRPSSAPTAGWRKVRHFGLSEASAENTAATESGSRGLAICPLFLAGSSQYAEAC